MGKHLRLYKKDSDYQNDLDGGKIILPNVSFTEDKEVVHYNPFVFDGGGSNL